MRFGLRAVLVGLWALAALPAGATPPDLVDVADTYLGFDAERVYLLRTVRDNLGVYTPEAVDLLLISVPFDPAAGEEVWPVSRTLLETDYSSDTATRSQAPIAITGAVDPLAVLAGRNLWPGVGRQLWDKVEAETDATALRFRAGGDGARFALPLVEAAEQLNARQAAVRATLPRYDGMPSRVDDYFIADPARFAEDCRLTSTRLMWRGPELPKSVLAGFFCAFDEYESSRAEIFLVVPPAD